MFAIRILTLLICLTALAVAQKEADLRVAPGKGVPGGKLLEWTSAEGKTYWYRVPKKINKKHPPSLILMLHGTGLPYGWAFWNYPIIAGRFRPNDIVVAPEGMTPGNGKTFNFIQGKRDGEHIAGLIKQFKKAFPIGHVYLYGHSQGAFFCYWFGGQYPALIDGFVAHAGNLLGNVKHPPIAKTKLAIGILHGKADAVVPVVCAHSTERHYKKLGYQKVKKYIVEGLTARSGHWPLPVQVGEMFDWLDQVSVSSPDRAVDMAIAQLNEKTPDLDVINDALARARGMKKKSEDTELLVERIALVEQFLTNCELAHREALSAIAAVHDKKALYGSWAAQFRSVAGAFGNSAAWQKGMKESRKRAKLHQKQIVRAMKGLGNPSAKSFRKAAKALQTVYLGGDYDGLRSRLELLLVSPPRGLKADDVESLRTMIEQRAAADTEGSATAAKITAAVAASFREEFGDALGTRR